MGTIHFIPARWLELAFWNQPMVARSYEMQVQRASLSEIDKLFLDLLPPERRKLRELLPLTCVLPPQRRRKRPPRPDQHHESLPAFHFRVKRASLEQHVVLSMQRDHETRELRPLALVDRQHIGQCQLVRVAEIVPDLPALKADDHPLLDPVDLLDQRQIAIENVTTIVVVGLDSPIPEAKRSGKPLDLRITTTRIDSGLEHLVQVPGSQQRPVHWAEYLDVFLGTNLSRLESAPSPTARSRLE